VTPRTPAGGLPRGRYYETQGGERLDQVAHAAYGRQWGVVEALLLYNPGLADLGFELPAGVAIELPPLDLSQGTAQEVALWS